MSDHINIGDTVEVRRSDRPSWRGEVTEFGPIDSREVATVVVQCTDAPARPPGWAGISPGQTATVTVDALTRVGDPAGMREDGCDDVDVTGRVRPYHRHAVTGEAHAHPGGGTAHTHQTPEQATNGLVITARAESGQADVVAAIQAASADPGPPCMRCGGDLLDHLLCAGPDGGPDEYRCLRDLAQDVLHDMQTSEPADDGDRVVDPAWVEVFEALATAHARSLISHEGPIVMDAVHYVVGRGWGKSQPPERPVWVLLQARPSSERGDIEPSRVIGVFDDPEDIPARLQFMARTVPYPLQRLGETCWRIGPEEQEGFFGFQPRTYYAVRATLTETARVTRRDAAPQEVDDRG